MLPTWLSNNDENPSISLADAASNPKVIAEVQRAVEVIAFVLQGLRHESVAAQLDGLLIEVDARDARPGVAQSSEAEARHREAPFVDRLALAAHLDELGVEHVADHAVDVVAEGAQRDADLGRGDARAARFGDRVEQIGDECSERRVEARDLIGPAAQHGVAEESNRSNGHASQTPRRTGMLSATSAANSRADCRVSGRSSSHEMTEPAARCSS